MVKRRNFKKSVKSAVTNAITKYQRRNLNYLCRAVYAYNSLQIDGVNQFVLGRILSQASSEYLALGRQYAMVKLRGIRITATPLDGQGSNILPVLALLQADDDDSFDAVRTQPHVLMLNFVKPTSIYIKVNGTFTATNSTTDITNLKLVPQYQGIISGQNSYVFGIKITLYLTFKSAL